MSPCTARPVWRGRPAGHVRLGAVVLVAWVALGCHRGSPGGDGPITSTHTPLAPERCTTVDHDDELGESTQRCPGVDGYALLVHDADARVSISMVMPDGTTYPLDLWHVVTRAFSRLGDQAEWRLRSRTPIALIVPVLAAEAEDGSERRYLAVVKLTSSERCVTDRIEPGPGADERARRAADSAATRPCLSALAG